MDLDFLLKREYQGGEVPAGAITWVMDKCLREIEKRGLDEVGLCESCSSIC